MIDDGIESRLDFLMTRLRESYDGIGYSSGRPYVYFVYPPERERVLRRLVDETLRDAGDLRFHHIDLLRLTIDRLRGQEEKRATALEGSMGDEAANGIVSVWIRALQRAVEERLMEGNGGERPVIAIMGLAALHPLSNPTAFMERLAEDDMRNPDTQQTVPTVLFVPGVRPPQTSRIYQFLGQPRLELSFYRGEEI
jgi:hypothetical protein